MRFILFLQSLSTGDITALKLSLLGADAAKTKVNWWLWKLIIDLIIIALFLFYFHNVKLGYLVGYDDDLPRRSTKIKNQNYRQFDRNQSYNYWPGI